MAQVGKTIGIVGVSAEGAALCYKTIVQEAGLRLGANVHPPVCLYNSSFADILAAQRKDDWEAVTQLIVEAIRHVALAGAEFVVVPANSIHFAIQSIQAQSRVPIISLLDVVADECAIKGYKRVGVLGVGITMSKALYVDTLARKGIEHVVPEQADQELINDIIYNEIVSGNIKPESVDTILSMIDKLKQGGCDAVVLACTELPLVISNNNSSLPIIDTTRLLAIKAVDMALADI